MQHFRRACDIYEYWTPSMFSRDCDECEEEITGDEPVFYEPDFDADDEGRCRDVSTYLHERCGVLRGEKVPA